MTSRQLLLYTSVGACALLLLASACVGWLATRRGNPLVERRAGDVGFLAFILALPLVVTTVTDDLRILLYALPLLALLAAAAVVLSPRCVECGERYSILRNRQFSRPKCLFCGKDEPLRN
jgi:hypothetical protein